MERYSLAEELERMAPGCVIVTVDHITQGVACTVLLAEKYIDNGDALMIANNDQFVDTDINDYLASMLFCDGLIIAMPASDPKWSYIRYNEQGIVTLVKEKEVISDLATVGIYNYKHGSDFVKYARKMIEKNIQVNDEFYVAPVYNEMIEAGMKITFCNVGEKMFGLGTPEDLRAFIKNPLSAGIF